jgi:glycosyltransferase involved in cell wall biosynthesis
LVLRQKSFKAENVNQLSPSLSGTVGRSIVALLGRRDEPTDGVQDYCTFLGQALAPRGVELTQVRVDWDKTGWFRALRKLRGECANWRGRWVLLQYTALSWSRRGFPFGALRVLAILGRAGARVAVVFHEPNRQDGSGQLQRMRGACQDWVIRRLFDGADKAIFTTPIELLEWLPKVDNKAVFIPIGANIPECIERRVVLAPATQGKTVIVFGVTGAPKTASEVQEIACVMKEASKVLPRLRLVVVGRGATEARELLAKALGTSGVELVVRGILPADQVAAEFLRADALLFVRGAITLRRGSAIAGIACGIPIVGYRNGAVGDLLEKAGIEWSPWHNQESLVGGLIRVLSDPERWIELHERNRDTQKNDLSWHRIAERYGEALDSRKSPS